MGIEKKLKTRGGSWQASAASDRAPPRVQSAARAMAILVAVAESPPGLRAMEIAQTLGLGRQTTYHLLHTLIGCGMLAHTTKEIRERYLAMHRLERRTANALTSRKALEWEFEKILESGYARDREEFALGLCCLAVPVGSGPATFAIGISAPSAQFEAKLEGYLRIMRRAVRSG